MAKKYTQTVIPIVENAQFSQMTMGELKKYVTQYFVENLKDKQVRNENKNIVIFLPKSGLRGQARKNIPTHYIFAFPVA